MVKIIRGLVRPIVTFAIAGLFCYCVVANILAKEAVIAIISMVFTFWFVDRVNQKDKERDEANKENLMDSVMTSIPPLVATLQALWEPKKVAKEKKAKKEKE